MKLLISATAAGTVESNGIGSNTSVQDRYNLAWKLAAVLHGQAGPELLETYSTERAPVAKQIVTRANKSSRVSTLDLPPTPSSR